MSNISTKNALINLNHISKSFKSDYFTNEVLKDVTFSVQKHEFVSILGHTGCGKSTLMRIIAGFETPDSGTVLLNGAEYKRPGRDIIMMFQDFNQLYPWKTALGNVVFALRESELHRDRREIEEIAWNLIREVGLENYHSLYPHQLSGGMRQRVAVARALSLNPKALIMDEPFSSIDEITRREMQKLCREVFEQHNTSVLFVTHSLDEAINVSDRILVMNQSGGNVIADFDNVCYGNPNNTTRRDFREKLLSYLII